MFLEFNVVAKGGIEVHKAFIDITQVEDFSQNHETGNILAHIEDFDLGVSDKRSCDEVIKSALNVGFVPASFVGVQTQNSLGEVQFEGDSNGESYTRYINMRNRMYILSFDIEGNQEDCTIQCHEPKAGSAEVFIYQVKKADLAMAMSKVGAQKLTAPLECKF